MKIGLLVKREDDEGEVLPPEKWVFRPRKDGKDDPTMDVKIFRNK